MLRQTKHLGRYFLTALAILSPALTAAAENADAIEFGILPTLSARTILTTYQPLRVYLEQHLKRPVQFVTAPDYRIYIERTQRGDYPYLITASHFARLAQKEAGYQPLVRVKRELDAMLVTDKRSGITTIEGLRGKSVSTPDSLAITSMLAVELFRAHGMSPGRDVNLHAQTSFNSALIAMHNGESAAAITAATALKQMPAEVRENLVVLATTKSVPHNVCLASSKVPPHEAAEMTRLLLAFGNTPAGEAFFRDTGFVGFVRSTEDDLVALDAYMVDLKRQLAMR